MPKRLCRDAPHRIIGDVLGDTEEAARLRAYELMELAQGDRHADALDELLALELRAEAHDWPEVGLLAAAGQALYDLVHGEDRAEVQRTLTALVGRAETLGSPSLTAVALSLRAVGAGGLGDTEALLTDAGRAVALAEDTALPALDRCTVLVVCGAAYNSLSLWELAHELYDEAAELAPQCERPVQDPALALNRILIHIEWGAALFELDDEPEALRHLGYAATAVQAALTTPDVPPLWQLDAAACGEVLGLVRDAFAVTPQAGATPDTGARLERVSRHRDALAAAADIEVLPLLDALVVLSLHRLGRIEEAVDLSTGLLEPGSSSTGARSFPGWVRAHVLTGDQPDETVRAHLSYGLMMARSRWTARLGALSAARSKIAGERLGVENARLSRDVHLDPLTGLANRRDFDAWLVRQPTVSSLAAVLLVDLDDFKVVNDAHGHAVGDEVLRQVARLVAGHVRAGDMALRLGGDEFAMVMTEDLEPGGGTRAGVSADLGELARTRARSLREAVATADWERVAPGLRVGVSVGVATGVIGPDEPGGMELLYRRADAQLYRAKSDRSLASAPR